MMDRDNGPCRTCGRFHDEPGYEPVHAFNNGSLSPSETFGKKGPDGVRRPRVGVNATGTNSEVTELPWPFDPVLRQALIDKGIITPMDLVNAEMKIRAVTQSMDAMVGVVAAARREQNGDDTSVPS